MNLNASNETDICCSTDDDQPNASSGYMLLGLLMTILCLCGFFENICVIFLFARNKTLRKKRNVFLVGLAVGDFGQALLNIPFVAISAFSHGWAFGYHMCLYYGFITSMLGLTQITILTVIAIDRYFLILYQKRVLSYSTKTSVCTIVFCFLNGALWSVGPLVGWSRYKLDTGDISCGIDWDLKEEGNLSFVISLFVCLWFIPLGLIVYSYTCIIRMVCSVRKNKMFMKARKEKKASRDRQVAITCLIMTGCFVITWLPYSVVSLWAALDDVTNIPELVQMSTAFFAKSAIIWNPVIYLIRHDHFRSACVGYFACFRWCLKDTRDISDDTTQQNGRYSTTKQIMCHLTVPKQLLEQRSPNITSRSRETFI